MPLSTRRGGGSRRRLRREPRGLGRVAPDGLSPEISWPRAAAMPIRTGRETIALRRASDGRDAAHGHTPSPTARASVLIAIITFPSSAARCARTSRDVRHMRARRACVVSRRLTYDRLNCRDMSRTFAISSFSSSRAAVTDGSAPSDSRRRRVPRDSQCPFFRGRRHRRARVLVASPSRERFAASGRTASPNAFVTDSASPRGAARPARPPRRGR